MIRRAFAQAAVSMGPRRLRSPTSIDDKSRARMLGSALFARGNLEAAWALFRRYDDLVILGLIRKANRSAVR